MKRLFILLSILVLLLSSCKTPPTESVIIDNSKAPLSHPTGDTLYIANTNSKTYHLSYCRFAISMKEENKYETYDLDFLISREFKPCKSCIKADY